MKHNANKGFTLIEVLVAATIIAILAAIGMVSYAQAAKRSRDAKRRADLAQIQAALEMWRTDNSTYPAGSDVNLASSDLGLVSGYIAAMPKDPKPSSFSYYYTAISSYAYCLSAAVENTSEATDQCPSGKHTGYNYFIKNP